MEYTTDKGITVVINKAPFGLQGKLKAAIAQGFLDNKIDLKEDLDPLSISAKVMLVIESSEACQKALFNCLERCTYNTIKITYDTFNDEAAQEEYYTILSKCVEVNLKPFFKGLS